MNSNFDELPNGLAQSVKRRHAQKRLGVVFARMTIANNAFLSEEQMMDT
jgi:hypothetical protein